ncbi:MAG: hypothetical protein RLZZ444_4312 [Pseudomonadota bacterium]|jgi:hypothetical protein
MTTISGTPIYLRLADTDGKLLTDDLLQESLSLDNGKPYDGETRFLGNRPSDFGDPATSTAFPTGFRYWNTIYQLEWLKEYAAAHPDAKVTTSDGGKDLSTIAVTLPYGSSSNNSISVMVTSGLIGQVAGMRLGVTILDDLTPEKLRRLTLDDQRLIAAHPEFNRLVAEPFALRPSAGESVAAARQAMKNVLLDLKSVIAAAGALPSSTDSSIPSDPAKLITGSIDLSLAALDKMAIFSPDAIAQLRADLAERYQRLANYGSALRGFETPGTQETNTTGYMSVDNRAGLRSTYEIFVQSAKRQLDVEQNAAQIADTGLFNGKSLDLAGLTYSFQVMGNYGGEAEMQARTEEIRARSSLLNIYSIVQKLINRTSAKVDDPQKSKDGVVDQPKGPLAYDPNNQAAEEKALKLFLAVGGVPLALHPAEVTLGIKRPTLTETTMTKSNWDLFASSLSGAVRVLDRDVQTLSDAVNSVSRERNRHFDMATEVVQKMSEMINTITQTMN